MNRGNTYQDTGQNFVYYVLFAIVFFAPMLRGLYFEKDMLYASIAVAGMFIWFLWSIRQRINCAVNSISVLDVALLCLFGAYLISTVAALKASRAVETDIRIAVYTMVYIMAATLAGSIRWVRSMLAVVYLSGVVIAVIGFAAYAGEQINGAISNGRLSSTFQYPNALGAYLAVMGILGCYLLLTATDPKIRMVVAAGNVLVFAALFATGSRGTFIFIPAAYLVMILLQPRDNKLPAALYTVSGFTMGGLVSFLISSKLGKPEVWGYVFLGVVLSILVHQLIDRFLLGGASKRLKVNKTVVLFMVIGLVALMLVGTLFASEASALKRITDINFKDRNVVERGYFYQDAFKIVKDYPVLGVGGGGWSSIYQAYQSYGYKTKQVHNFYLQTWVETGILGIIAIILVFVGLMLIYRKILRTSNPEIRTLGAAALGAVVMIGMHSSIDFTMAYGAMGILMWALLGILRGISTGENYQTAKATGSNVLAALSAAIIPVVVGLVSISLLVANMYEDKAMEAMKKKDIYGRLNFLEQAVTYNPLDGDHYANLAVIERVMYKKDKKPEHLDKALAYMEKAINRDKGSMPFRVEKINLMFALKKPDLVPKEAEEALRLEPWGQESYEMLAYCYLSAGKLYLKAGDTAKARENFEKVPQIPKLMRKKMDTLTDQEKQLWIATPHLQFSKKLQNYLGQAVMLEKRN